MATRRRRDCATPFSSPLTPWYNLLGLTNDRQLARGDQHVYAIRQFLQSCIGDRAWLYISSLSSASRSREFAMYAFFVRLCSTAIWFSTAFAVLPPYIKPCKKSDPDINKCIVRSIEQLRDELSAGIPELGVPPIEPLNLKEIRLSRGPAGARLDMNLTNMQVFGPSTFKIRDLKADIENVVFTFKVDFEKLTFQGKYQIDATILLLKMTGQGDITGSFTDYEIDNVLRAHKLYKDNEIYLNFEKIKMKMKINKAQLHFNNLFGGDNAIAAATHELINNNNDLILNEVMPELEIALAEHLTNVANKITKTFTYKELFSDN